MRKFISALLTALGILCIFYSFLVRSVGSGTFFFFAWIATGLLFFGAAFVIRKEILKNSKKWLKIFISTVILICLIIFVSVEIIIISCFVSEPAEGLDYIICLGAQVYETGPSAVLRYRLDETAEYMKENPDTVCIVTGSQGWNEPCTEAETMYRYLTEHGIDGDRIIPEPEAHNTAQNIRFSRAFIPDGATVGIVTNNFHLFRALCIARAAGLSSVCGISAKSNPVFLPSNMYREFFGIIKFLIIDIHEIKAG